MKMLKVIAVIFFINVLLFSQGAIQDKKFDYISYGQMIYWKALRLDEKKVFLYAYLYRTNEILNQFKESKKLKPCADTYKKVIVDPLFEVFSDLDEKKKEELIDWIDIFYRSDLNKEKIFYSALMYAFEKVKSGRESLYDIYKKAYE